MCTVIVPVSEFSSGSVFYFFSLPYLYMSVYEEIKEMLQFSIHEDNWEKEKIACKTAFFKGKFRINDI